MRPLTFDFTNKVVLVTGSTRGIGRVIADQFAICGAHVVVTARSEDDVARVSGEMRGAGYEVTGFVCDVCDEQMVGDLFGRVRETYGGVDVIVNNAALREHRSLDDTSMEHWNQMLATNLTGAYLVARAARTQFSDRGGGAIINIGSIVSECPPAYFEGVHYVVSKAGLIALTRGLAREMGVDNVRVNAVVPNVVATGELRPEYVYAEALRTAPLSRITTAEDVAHCVLFLSSRYGASVTGQVIALGSTERP